MLAEHIQPAFSYFGGKAQIAPWVVRHFPPHQIFVDLFGGAANIILNKTPVMVNVYNDLDGDIVNFFRVLREQPEELIQQISLTPYSRAEFEQARKRLGEGDVERARRLYVLMRQANRPGKRTGRSWRYVYKHNKSISDEWKRSIDNLQSVADALDAINPLIECDDAFNVIPRYDSADTLFYVDPPYLRTTRGDMSHIYKHDMPDRYSHLRLALRLRRARGMVVLSGYPSEMYKVVFANWRRVETTTHDRNTNSRVECLWINPRAWTRLQGDLGPLFAGLAREGDI